MFNIFTINTLLTRDSRQKLYRWPIHSSSCNPICFIKCQNSLTYIPYIFDICSKNKMNYLLFIIVMYATYAHTRTGIHNSHVPTFTHTYAHLHIYFRYVSHLWMKWSLNCKWKIISQSNYVCNLAENIIIYDCTLKIILDPLVPIWVQGRSSSKQERLYETALIILRNPLSLSPLVLHD